MDADFLACWCSFVMIGLVVDVCTFLKGISPLIDSAVGSIRLNSRWRATSWGSRTRDSPGDRDRDLEPFDLHETCYHNSKQRWRTFTRYLLVLLTDHWRFWKKKKRPRISLLKHFSVLSKSSELALRMHLRTGIFSYWQHFVNNWKWNSVESSAKNLPTNTLFCDREWNFFFSRKKH